LPHTRPVGENRLDGFSHVFKISSRIRVILRIKWFDDEFIHRTRMEIQSLIINLNLKLGKEAF